jgi:hypothetical protein
VAPRFAVSTKVSNNVLELGLAIVVKVLDDVPLPLPVRTCVLLRNPTADQVIDPLLALPKSKLEKVNVPPVIVIDAVVLELKIDGTGFPKD